MGWFAFNGADVYQLKYLREESGKTNGQKGTSNQQWLDICGDVLHCTQINAVPLDPNNPGKMKGLSPKNMGHKP